MIVKYYRSSRRVRCVGARCSQVLGQVAFGTSASIQSFTKNILFDEKIGGTVHTPVSRTPAA